MVLFAVLRYAYEKLEINCQNFILFYILRFILGTRSCKMSHVATRYIILMYLPVIKACSTQNYFSVEISTIRKKPFKNREQRNLES